MRVASTLSLLALIAVPGCTLVEATHIGVTLIVTCLCGLSFADRRRDG